MRLETTATAWDEQRTMPRRWGTSLDRRDSGCRRLPTDDGATPTARVEQGRRMNDKGMTLGRQRARRLVAQDVVHAKRTGGQKSWMIQANELVVQRWLGGTPNVWKITSD